MQGTYRVVLDLDESDGPEVYDNLVFNTVRVPEPSTLALMVLGLAAIGFTRSRRRRRGVLVK